MRWLLLLALWGCGDDDGGAGGGGDAADARTAGGDSSDPAWDAAPGCGTPAPFDVGVTYENTIYVAPDGSDGADGSLLYPLQTLDEAASRATPSTRIVFATGVYPTAAFVAGLQGEAGRPIALVAQGEVVFDAGGAGEVLHLSDPRYLVLEGFTLRNATGNGLNVDDGGSIDTPAEFVVLRNLTVQGIGTGGNNDCIKLSGVDRFHVLGSDVSGCSAGDAIDMVGCHEGVIAGNTFHDTPGGGIQAKGGSADTLIQGNRFVDIAGRAVNAGGSTGLEFFRPIDAPHEAARLRIAGNLFLRASTADSTIAYVGCDGCVFANNTVIEPHHWLARILQETVDARFVPSRNGLFVNNLVVLRAADLSTLVNVGPDTAPETFTFGSNLWWDLGDPTFSPSYPAPIPAGSGEVTGLNPNLVAGDEPHIAVPSPAIGAGREVAGGPPGDFDGDCWAAPRAIGADQP